jgi:hypothetical protein
VEELVGIFDSSLGGRVGEEVGCALLFRGLGSLSWKKGAGHMGNIAGAWVKFPNPCNVMIATILDLNKKKFTANEMFCLLFHTTYCVKQFKKAILTRDQQPMSHCREGVRIFVSEV